MNESIHNEQVAAFQVKVKEHENDVIDGKKVAHDINEFVELHNELNGVIKEYEDLYKNTKDEKYKLELDAYLKEELDYLDLITELMDNLEKYHDMVGVVDANEVSQEWEDIRTIVIRNNLSRSLKRMEKLAESDNKYASLYEEYKSKHDRLLDKAINAEYRFIKKFTLEQNTIEVESSIVEKTPSLLLNKDVYEKMNLEEKIKYLEIIMSNIKKMPGKKRTGVVNGKRINVAKKYYARYAHYTSLLNNLYEKKEIEEKEIIKSVTSLTPEMQVYKEKMDKILSTIERFAYHDNMAVDFSETTNVILPDGTIFRILKSDVEKFESEKQKYIELKEYYDRLSLENKNNEINYEDLGEKIEDQISNEINSVDIEKYWASKHQLEDNRRAISVMEMRSEGAKEEDCISVKSIDGKQIKILKTDLETFENIKKNNNQAFENIEKIMVNNNEEGLSKEEQKALYNTLNKNNEEESLLEKIKFIRDNIENSENSKNKLKDLVKKLSVVKKAKRLINVATLAHLFKKRGYDEEEAKALADRFVEPYEFLKDKKHSDEHKKSMFSKASEAIKSYFDTSNDELESEEVETNKLNEILKATKSLPKKSSKYISKVKETKKVKNKVKLSEEVKKRAKKVAAVLGFAAVITIASTSSQKDTKIDKNPKVTTESDTLNKEETSLYAGVTKDLNEALDNATKNLTDEEIEKLGNKIDKIANNEEKYESIHQENIEVPVEEVNNVYIGDVFTIDNNAPIYTNMYDAKDEVNKHTAYFEDDSKREVTGVAYDFNGSMILLDRNDPEFESKKTALENNGAHIVAVRSENEHSQGHEGYFDIDDINIGGRSR